MSRPDGLSPALVVVRSVGSLHGAITELGMALAEALNEVDLRGAEPALVQAISEAAHQAQQARATLSTAAKDLRSIVRN